MHLTAALPPSPEMLALARAHRDRIAALLAERAQQAERVGLPTSPGIPRGWTQGVALLAGRPAPDSITPPRWRACQASAARLLRDHGAALNAGGWDALDLFGLHYAAPMTNPSGWGLVWLLGEHGEVLDITSDVVGLRRKPGGARLAYRRPGPMTPGGVVPAWNL